MDAYLRRQTESFSAWLVYSPIAIVGLYCSIVYHSHMLAILSTATSRSELSRKLASRSVLINFSKETNGFYRDIQVHIFT